MNALKVGGEDNMPVRPAYGTEGTPMTVYANYVQFTPKADLVLYMYHLQEERPKGPYSPGSASEEPELVGKKRGHVIRLLLDESSQLRPFKNDVVTDFRTILISRKKLDLKDEVIDFKEGGDGKVADSNEWEHPVFSVTYKKEGEDLPRDRAPVYKIPFMYVKTLTIGELMAYLTSTNPTNQYAHQLDAIQGLNIFFNHYAKTNKSLVTIGASKTFTMASGAFADSQPLGQGLIAIRGFFTSVRAATNRVLININVSHGAFYQEGRLGDLILAFKASGRQSDGAVEKFIKKVRVRTSHLKDKKDRKGEVVIRAKTIYGLAKPFREPRKAKSKDPNPPIVDRYGAGPKGVQFFLRDKAPASTASTIPGAQATPKKGKGKGKPTPAGPAPAGSGGHYVTVYKYFKDTYNLETSDNFPVVNVGNDEKPSYLPAEVCIVLPGQTASAKLSAEQTRSMIAFAVRKPWQNAESIEKNGFSTAGLSNTTNTLLVSDDLLQKSIAANSKHRTNSVLSSVRA